MLNGRKRGRSMDSINNYKDLCREIEVLELRIESIESEIKQIKKLMIQGPKDITGIDYSREPSGSIVHIPLDRLIDRLERLEETIGMLMDALEQKKQYKGKMEDILSKFDGIHHKVMYLRLVEGLTVEQVAEKLEYTERQIYNILGKCKKTLNTSL